MLVSVLVLVLVLGLGFTPVLPDAVLYDHHDGGTGEDYEHHHEHRGGCIVHKGDDGASVVDIEINLRLGPGLGPGLGFGLGLRWWHCPRG